MKRFFATLFLCLSFLSINSQNAPSDQSIQWSINDRGILTVKGQTMMTDYNKGETPWYYFREKIQMVIIEEGVTCIGSYAFADCKQLNFVSIPQSVRSIGHHAFYNCTNLTSVNIPQNVTEIGAEAFCKCSNLQNVILSPKIQRVEVGLFEKCINLPSISIPEGVTRIEARAFASCKSLKDCIIPLGVDYIGVAAFKECASLKDIIVPDKVTSIERETFYKCSLLEKVVLGNSLRYISDRAFIGCPRLTEVYCYATTIPRVENDPFGGKGKVINLWVPNTHYYAMHEYWKKFQLRGEDKEEQFVEQGTPEVIVQENHPVASLPMPEVKEMVQTTEIPAENSTGKAYVVTASSSLNVRSAASPKASVLGGVHSSDTVYVSGVENGTWGRILYKGKTGYVSTKFLREVEEYALTNSASVVQTVESNQDATIASMESSSTMEESNNAVVSTGPQFAMYYGFVSGYVGGQKGNKKVLGGVGGDFMLGVRSTSRVNFLGVGLGMHATFMHKMSYLYMPIYAIDKIFFSTGEGTNPFFDVSAGGYVNLMSEVYGKRKAGKGGGFFMRTGLGLDFDGTWQIGIGYQMMGRKKVSRSLHGGYIKVDIGI